MTSTLVAPRTAAPVQIPARPVNRWVAAGVLLAGATLQLVEELLEPPFSTDEERFAWIANHSTWHAIDIGIGLVAVPLLIASVLLLAQLAGRMPRLARVGAGLCVIGFCGLAAVHGFEFAEVAILDAGMSPVALAAAVQTVQPAIAIPMLEMFLGALTVGLSLLLVALWTSRAVPRGAIVVTFAFMLLDFAGPELPFPSHGLSFIAFAWMAVALAFGRRPGSTTS